MKRLHTISAFGLMMIFISSDLKTGRYIDERGKNEFKMTSAFPNLQFYMPVELTSPADNTDRMFVIAQKGQILVFPNKGDIKSASVFLGKSFDIT